jgi:hypothetical protein
MKMTLQERNDLVKAALAEVASPELQEEVEYYLDIDDEEQRPHDYYDALEQAESLAEDCGDRKTLTAARKALIALGVYRHWTDEELACIQVFTSSSRSHKKWDFILGGKKYKFENHLK